MNAREAVLKYLEEHPENAIIFCGISIETGESSTMMHTDQQNLLDMISSIVSSFGYKEAELSPPPPMPSEMHEQDQMRLLGMVILFAQMYAHAPSLVKQHAMQAMQSALNVMAHEGTPIDKQGDDSGPATPGLVFH